MESCVENVRRSFTDKSPQFIAILTVASGILGIAYLRFKPVPIYGDYLLKIILGIALVLWVFAVTTNYSPKNKVSTWLGTHSFEIYLYHGLVMSLLVWIDGKLNLGIQSGAFIALTFAITFFIAVPMHALNKKISTILKKI